MTVRNAAYVGGVHVVATRQLSRFWNSASVSLTVAPVFYQGFLWKWIQESGIWGRSLFVLMMVSGCGLQTHLSRNWQPVSKGATQQLSDNERPQPPPHQDIKH